MTIPVFWIFFLISLVSGDISEKLRQGLAVGPARNSNFPGLQPPLLGQSKGGGFIKGGPVRQRQAGATNTGRIILPSHHGDDDENNLDRLCNDPFHSFLCKPVGPRKHRFDGNLRPGAIIPAGTIYSGQSSNVQESKEKPLTSGGALLSDEIDAGYQYPKPTNTFDSKLPTEQPGYSYPQPQNNNQLLLPQQTIQGYQYDKPDNQLGYQYDKPDNQLAYPSQQVTTKAPPPGPAYEYLPGFPSQPNFPGNNRSPSFFSPQNQPTNLQPTTVRPPKLIPQPSFTFTSSNFLPVAKTTNPQITYSYPKPSTQFPIVAKVTTPSPPPSTFIFSYRTTVAPIRTTSAPSRVTFTNSIFTTPKPLFSSTTRQPFRSSFQSLPTNVVPVNNNYLPPLISPVPKPSNNPPPAFSGQGQLPQSTSTFRVTQPPFSSPPPRQYAPAIIVPVPRPSNNFQLTLPFNQPPKPGYQYPVPTNQFPVTARPTTTTLAPTTRRVVTRPSNEYLPPDNRIGESTNLQPNIEGGALLAEEIEPSGSGRSSGQRKHERNHTLEELCNDAFHMFLCTPIKIPRKRLDGRIRPGAKIPANVLLSAGSSFAATRDSPNREGSALLSEQLDNGGRYSGYQYQNPQIPFQSTNLSPQTYPIPNPFFIVAASDNSALAKYFNIQTNALQSTNKPTTTTSTTTTTTTTTPKPKPTTTKQPSTTRMATTPLKEVSLETAGSNAKENKGYYYDRPTGPTLTLPTKKPTGYSYTRPLPGREFTLPVTKPSTPTPTRRFGARLFTPNLGQSQIQEQAQVQEEVPFPELNENDKNEITNDEDLPPASQFEIIKP